MTSQVVRNSDLDGRESGGFIVVNIDARQKEPCQVLEDEFAETYFESLARAREVCARLRAENNNDMIFVYAVTAIREVR